MENEIERIRQETSLFLDTAVLCPDEGAAVRSPDGQYLMDIDVYRSPDPDNHVRHAAATVRSAETGEVVVAITRNFGDCFYAWISREGHDYLLFPEDLEGQTVIDLTERRLSSFASQEDPFIWAEFYPSPDRSKLAIIGCYWACPYIVRIYDFSGPMDLPLPVTADFDLQNNSAEFRGWLSEESIGIEGHDGAEEFTLPH